MQQEGENSGHSRSVGRRGLGEGGWTLGEGEQATEVRMQARSSRGGRREKPDQGGAYTRAELETALKSERESGGKKLR